MKRLPANQIEACIIFGGSGFIGSHFSRFLLDEGMVKNIYIYDINPIRSHFFKEHDQVHYIHGDVRQSIVCSELPSKIDLIINLAAIHREPGHLEFEYFETNLLGAENVCKFAEEVGCKSIIFTSSISPYGVSEAVKDESTLPIPKTAYGSSKLVAEKIHQIWRAKDKNCRQLIIVRPGVVFGPGEGGNVSRLIKAVTHRYFFFMGNRATRKAGIYVKELCHAMLWALERKSENGETFSLFNASMSPGPSIGEYVDAIQKTQGFRRMIPAIPYKALIALAYAIDAISRPLGIEHPFSPVRIRKLVRSNNILPTYLVENGYELKYTLESAFADWKESCPQEWQ